MGNITNMIAEGKGKRLYATDNPDEAVIYYRDENDVHCVPKITLEEAIILNK